VAQPALGGDLELAVGDDPALAVEDARVARVEPLADAARLARADPARVRDRPQQVDARRPCRKSSPTRSALSMLAIESAVCSSVLDGMPSVSVQLPPSVWRSTIVTSRARSAAVVAAA
jgi:hypothetical protein